jgi:zinc transport system substrate-binding protein
MLKYLTVCSTLLATPLAAESPRIVTDIPPVHSLTAQVMGDLGTPELLTKPGTSPHGHALRPSEAKRLQDADLLVWVGPLMSPWLDKAKGEMAPDAASLPLMQAAGITLLDKRGAHNHDHGHDHGDEAHEAAETHEEGHDHEEHAEGHDHDHDEHKDEHAHDDHADEVAEDIRKDSHVWLDPENAVIWLPLIAEELAKLDPDNAAAYRANAMAAAEAIKAQIAETTARLAPFEGGEFLTAHDAYQYFEARFGLTSHAAVTDADDQDAGPAHLRELLTEAPDLGCFVTEPSTPEASIQLITETLEIPAVEIDPLGAELPVGAGHYNALMNNLAEGFEACLRR